MKTPTYTPPTFYTMAAPAFLASYYINADASGLTDDEQAEGDAFIELHGIEQIMLEADSEAYFGRFPYPWTVAGDLLDYTVTLRPDPWPVIESAFLRDHEPK